MAFDWSKIAGIVKKAAPVLGTALGGPVGSVAGGAVSLLLSAFGINEDEADAPDQLLTALRDPEAAVKLRELELRHKERLEELILENRKIEIKREQVRLADVADARDREKAIVKTTGKTDTNLYLLAWVTIIGVFVIMGILMSWKLPEGSSQAVFLMLGALTGGYQAVLQYFFGSSKSSSDKTKLMAGKK